MFDGKPVESVRLLILRLYNSGTTPIAPADYISPVSITFPDTAQLVETEVLVTDPKNLGAAVRVEGQSVIVDPVLLNRGDSITLKLILAQSTGAFAVDWRIIGVKQIQAPNIRTLRVLQKFVLFGLFLATSIGLVAATQVLADLGGLWVVVPPLFVTLVGYFFVSIFLFTDSD